MELQHLQPCRLLSVTYVDGVVRVTGGDKGDDIEVKIIADESGPSAYAVVNGQRTDFTTPDQSTSEVPRKVIINSGRGNDVIELGIPYGRRPARINTGDGDDEITVFNDGSVVAGGDGDDVIILDGSGFEFARGDTVAGGDGDDVIRSSALAADVFHRTAIRERSGHDSARQSGEGIASVFV